MPAELLASAHSGLCKPPRSLLSLLYLTLSLHLHLSLCDAQSIYGAFDPDQSRTEDAMADEALTNKEESREALSFVGRLIVIPLITGALISRAITDPVLSFSLQVRPQPGSGGGERAVAAPWHSSWKRGPRGEDVLAVGAACCMG